jgi:hypothetical protein
MRCLVLASVLVIPAVISGQLCPKSSNTGPNVPSEVRTLEGRLNFHEGIRNWFELKLDEPQCEQASIQLVHFERAETPLEVFRGCRVRSRGAIDFSPTGYYSLALYQDVQAIESVGNCKRRSPFAKYPEAKPNRAIRAYRVDMHVNYEPGDHPVVFRITRAGKELRPWQAYANYLLTGGFVLYGHCGDGFVVDKVFGTPEAHPSHFDEPRSSADMAMFDPETAATKGKRDLQLGYTCVRDR